MKTIKDELQHIILGDEPTGQTSKLKKVQRFLRSNEETSLAIKKQQRLKSKEAASLLAFGVQEDIIYNPEIRESDFISEGAEQKVYRLDGTYVIKTNAGLITSTACSSTIISFRLLLIHFLASK